VSTKGEAAATILGWIGCTLMAVHLVRHAKAGNRQTWTEPDELRPLSKAGQRQAAAVTASLAEVPVSVIWSSAYVRCVQTVEPLAVERGLEIAVSPALAEGMGFEAALALLSEVPDHAVLCSHGDVIPEVIEALHRRGVDIGLVDWRKATRWVLERDGDGSAGQPFIRAYVVPPPDR
jgi:8-oxo-dGTP diphosphatase